MLLDMIGAQRLAKPDYVFDNAINAKIGLEWWSPQQPFSPTLWCHIPSGFVKLDPSHNKTWRHLPLVLVTSKHRIFSVMERTHLRLQSSSKRIYGFNASFLSLEVFAYFCGNTSLTESQAQKVVFITCKLANVTLMGVAPGPDMHLSSPRGNTHLGQCYMY